MGWILDEFWNFMYTLWHCNSMFGRTYSAKYQACLNVATKLPTLFIFDMSLDNLWFKLPFPLFVCQQNKTCRPGHMLLYNCQKRIITLCTDLHVFLCWQRLQKDQEHENCKKFDKKCLAESLIKKCLANGRLFLPLKSAADTDTDCWKKSVSAKIILHR